MTASIWFPPVIPFDLRLHPCSLPLYIKPSLTQSTQSLVLTNLNLNPKLPGSASARKQSRAVSMSRFCTVSYSSKPNRRKSAASVMRISVRAKL